MASANLNGTGTISSQLWTTNLFTTAGTTLQYTPSMPQFFGSVTDPLGQMPAKPRPETPEEWLRRRVRETCWKAA